MLGRKEPPPATETITQKMDRLACEFNVVASRKMDHWDELKSAMSDMRSAIRDARGAADRMEGAMVRILSALSNDNGKEA